MSYELIQKPAFMTQLLALPTAEIPRILEKVSLLQTAPQPDAKNKKRLKGYTHAIYRIRCGTYRILYSFGDGWVTLLGVDHRKDVYDGEDLLADAPEFDLREIPSDNDDLFATKNTAGDYQPKRQSRSAEDDLPFRFDRELLTRMRVPDDFAEQILSCKTIDHLLAIDIPEPLRERLFTLVSTPDYERVLEQPSFETGAVDDLLRYHEGELLDFLLKLDPEQEKFVDWAVKGAGPTLVKGGPGTGKSTIALYRVKSLLDVLKASGVANPKILFTTYTNALVASSRQLLGRILGEDAAHVTVRTADSIVREIVEYGGAVPDFIDQSATGRRLDEAFQIAAEGLSTAERRMQAQLIERLSGDYIYTEIESVIIARSIMSLEDYLQAPRNGRRVGLNLVQRKIIWRIYEAFDRLLARNNETTWSRLRREALDLVREGVWTRRFDGVVIDESQDLEPTVLRLLVNLCRTPDRLFVTADANQSIYGSSFRWTDVHADLKFTGRTGVLRRNHRSTRDIGEATRSYLRNAALELPDAAAITYTSSGLLPVVRWVDTNDAEIALLARFLREAARDARVGMGSCAVLAPGQRVGQEIARKLSDAGIEARFMPGRELDLEARVVKVITQQSAKGLEFPIVVVAGLRATRHGTPMSEEAKQEAEEQLLTSQRTMYVAMTRAMRALLVVLPEGNPSPLLTGFDAELWNTGTIARS